ncbi:MAG: N-6 DNA methylase [Bacteroidales bacterium]
MLDVETKNRINTARDILVGKVPDPKSQVEQITIALIYKFMDDMDVEAEELGGKRTFFVGEYAKYAWRKIFDPRQSGYELLNLYSEAITKMDTNPGVPKLFRDIFKNAYLPYRDPETLKSFLKIINDFEYSHSEKLGDAFEFLLSILGSQGDAGQFRTPRHIIDFMVAIIDPKKHEVILDPACGTAGFLISSYKHIVKQNSSNYLPEQNTGITVNGTQSVNEVIITINGYNGDKLTADERRILADNIHGYDISPDMVRLSLVNMYLHGIKEPHISEYDTLTSEDHWNQFCDVILANPPFMSPKGGIRPHKRFSVQSNRSEVLFVDYIAEHLTPDGRAAVIVPEGIIFQSGTAYKNLRKMLVEKYLVGVISLPAGVFQPYSGVKTSILWLDKVMAKKTDKILFVKIENDGFDLGAQRRQIKENDLPVVIENIRNYKLWLSQGKPFDCGSTSTLLCVEKSVVAKDGNYAFTGERYKESSIRKHTDYDLIAIGDLCDLINGRAFKPSDWEQKEKGGVPIIRIQNLNDPSAGYNYFSGKISSSCLVEHGELLFSWSGSKGSSFGAHIWRGDKAILNQHIFKVKYDTSRATKNYLYYALNKAVEEVEQNLHGGVGLVHITKGNLEKIQIPLPPLSIQEEIVAEIESYQKIIDGARMVVENYKPRIEIDPEWEMVELGVVAKPKYGFTERAKDEGDARFIRITDIGSDGKLINTDKKYISLTKEAEKCIVKRNDILVARTGATYGKTMIYEDDYPAVFASFLMRLQFDRTKVFPKYYWIFAQSDNYISQAASLMTGGGQPQFNGNAIVKIKLPLPPIGTQMQIVLQIENEMGAVNTNKQLITLFEDKIRYRIAKVWGE